MKKLLALFLTVLVITLFCSCNGKNNADSTSVKVEKPQYVEVGENGSRTSDPLGFQLELPEVDEEIVILKTNKGDIYIRLFKDSAPIAVTNFIGLCKSGYFNNLTFHRVVEELVIQSGDPQGDGKGGQSIWGECFEDEFNANLLNIRGAVAMANKSEPNTNGSQFYINQRTDADKKSDLQYDSVYTVLMNEKGDTLRKNYDVYVAKYGDVFTTEYPTADDYVADYLEKYIKQMILDSSKVPDEVWDFYSENGGNITLDGAWKSSTGHTVFGQVFKGMDIVDAIAETKTDENYKPLEDIIIESAVVTPYTADMAPNLEETEQ